MKLLGKIRNNKKEEILYVVKTGNMYMYYLNDDMIGVYDPYTMEDMILFRENTKTNELSGTIKDEVIKIAEQQDKKDILKMGKDYTKEHVENIEKMLGLEKGRKITRIAEIGLDEEIEENKQKKAKEKSDEEEEKKIAQYANEKDVNVKQEIDVNEKVTDMKTFGQLLQKEGKLPQLENDKISKVAIIESADLNNVKDENGVREAKETTRYAMVGITAKGKVVPLGLEQDSREGNDPMDRETYVTPDGEVKKDSVLTTYKLGNGAISIDNGQMGEIEVSYTSTKTLGGDGIEGNQGRYIPVRTDNVYGGYGGIDKQIRDLAQEHNDGYRDVQDGAEEVREHQKNAEINTGEKCENPGVEAIDGDKNTKSDHIHLPEEKITFQDGEEVSYEELAIKWGYRKSNGEPDAEHAKEVLESKMKESPELTADEAVEEVSDELEEQMMPGQDNRGH